MDDDTDIRYLQEVLGRESITTTKWYLHVSLPHELVSSLGSLEA